MGQCTGKSATTIEKNTGSPTENTKAKTDHNNMGDVIISAEDLKKLVDAGAGNLKVLDVTQGDEAGYKSDHIPGAVYMDIFREVQNTDYLIRNLPTPEVFETYVRSLGISADSDVIVYDRSETGCGYMLAGRAWFLFRYHGHDKVRILDGGLAKWKEAKYNTSSEVPSPEAGTFSVSVNKDLLKSYEEMVENLDTKAYQVLDTRPQSAFSQGHIAGAKNIPFNTKLLDTTTKRLRTPEELKTAFEEVNIDLSKPAVASCTGGITSCIALVAAAVLGRKDVALYVGSWIEWNQRASESQIEKD